MMFDLSFTEMPWQPFLKGGATSKLPSGIQFHDLKFVGPEAFTKNCNLMLAVSHNNS